MCDNYYFFLPLIGHLFDLCIDSYESLRGNIPIHQSFFNKIINTLRGKKTFRSDWPVIIADVLRASKLVTAEIMTEGDVEIGDRLVQLFVEDLLHRESTAANVFNSKIDEE
jgi:hypothetical protein